MNQKKVQWRSNCKTCTHSSVAEAERLLALGNPVAQVARRLGIPSQAIRRHWANHVSDDRRARLKGQALFKRDVNPEQLLELRERERDGLLLRLSVQRSDLTLLTKDEDKNIAIKAHRALLALHELVAKVLGEISPSSVTNNNTQVNIGQGDLLELRATIEAALADEPRARAKLLAALAREPREVLAIEAAS